ncbi:MAG TPA: DUF2802 domain-containing protein [Bdellovibrio sp.]|nr:DUF2802 domain-containing protein [Bdellovibrio sp.]
MSFWVLLQLFVDIILLAGVIGLWIRLNRPPKDDPRLSKGLQLLQSKIAVLEDLSDRTETQVNQLTALLEQKVKDIQSKIQSSEKQIAKIDLSMQKSLEVAKIFQDRIPHNEIVERQNTIKYVKAARLAHQGLSVDEIADQVTELSRGEIEFIAKINREQLMFCEESLPEWAQAQTQDQVQQDMSSVFEVPKSDSDAMKKLGEAFKAACLEVDEEEATVAPATPTIATPTIATVTQEISQNFLGEKPQASRAKPVTNKKMDGVIRPVEFRRIDMAKDLG